ncbi:MAG TPA: hypothetical protein VL095_09735 [Flavisolibacter sp.]|jgi:hypothetical protein|nr:hypothetical protein [Flavisolibacter sp.]
MRKVFTNKWFFLAAFLTLSLSAISFVAYQKTQSAYVVAMKGCQDNSACSNERTDMLWELLSKPFSNFISIR